jgi:exopolysaccharide biosynthesis polyprenyl glycosylphosphotransferase
MKKSELFFSALQVPVDFAMVVFAGLTAFFLRRWDEVIRFKPILYEYSLREYLQALVLVGAYFVIVYAIDGLYNTRATRRTLGEIYSVFRATMIGLMIIVVGIFLNPDWYSSRFVVLAGGSFVVIFVSLARILLGFIQRRLLIKKGIGVHRLVLVGMNGFCPAIKRGINRYRHLGYRLVEHVDDVDIERLNRIKKMKGMDEVIHCDSGANKDELLKLKNYCMRNRVAFKYVPTILQASNFEMQMFLGEPIIEIKNTPLDGWGKIIKRVFDIIGALVGIVVFGPLMLLVYLLILIQSGRPVIFFNERVGHKGNFDLYKFRYMKKEYSHGKQFSQEHNKKALAYLENLIASRSIKSGPVYKIKDDPRKTKLGSFLEKYSLDEFPQFFNVLKGQMSLVGPRPHQPIEVEKYEEYQKRLLTIKPGITGMAQISGRSDLEFKDEVRLDTYYIENWSLKLDVLIIFKTILTLLRKRRN